MDLFFVTMSFAGYPRIVDNQNSINGWMMFDDSLFYVFEDIKIACSSSVVVHTLLISRTL